MKTAGLHLINELSLTRVNQLPGFTIFGFEPLFTINPQLQILKSHGFIPENSGQLIQLEMVIFLRKPPDLLRSLRVKFLSLFKVYPDTPLFACASLG